MRGSSSVISKQKSPKNSAASRPSQSAVENNRHSRLSVAKNLDFSEIASSWLSEKTMKLGNPLVVILGIGEYDGMPNLIGVNQDYKNIILIFNKLFGYDILYKLSNDEYNKDKCLGNIDDAFKLQWNCDEIDDFIDDAKELIENKDLKYDSLIFLVSSHGDADGVILDSECEEYSLLTIFAGFDGNKLPHFAHCPKLFFVDACRGTMRSKVVETTIKFNEKSKEIIAIPKGNNNENKEQKSGKFEDLKMNIHSQANFFIVYANPDGYAAFDGGIKGGYLIQSIYKVFKKKQVLRKNLDGIVLHIAEKVKQLTGRQSMQHVQTVSTVHFRIQFKPHL